MYESFENLPDEKKKKIIDVCIEEFAINGYEKTSTNVIVKKAGISKGILFHYFKNKKYLYLYLIDYVLDKYVKEFYEFVENQPTDIFDRLMNWGLKKLQIYFENPVEYRFLAIALLKIPDEVKEDLHKRYDKLSNEIVAKILEGIDYTKFRRDIDTNKAIKFIIIALESVGNKYMEIYKDRFDDVIADMDRIMEDFKEYMEILKSGVYANELSWGRSY